MGHNLTDVVGEAPFDALLKLVEEERGSRGVGDGGTVGL